MTTGMNLEQALLAERKASFFRLRGAYPIPLAGAIWWAFLGIAGYKLHSHLWIFLAFVTSGTLFPLALLLAKLFGIDFMRDRTSIRDMIFPALISMLLFWPIAISAYWSYPQLVPLILAIGMAIQWPVIGWMYGHTALYTTHALVRAITCFVLWNWLPSTRFTLLPMAVSVIYLLTIGAILIASSDRAKAASESALELAR
ncbi:DUF7010 family protein [Granulicella mallensis]|uniref:Uncharacterized protein n=1 Tax=Granulicella mallensis (strain ATCC BAA-1857 / DSM 23137 / MP5ACTX8) TaxID=682795 RepID=G8NWR8_GRAMM|nr:hypothetical protein [Granulicella mallensis]AEU38955.1 hypothetical protein AciX8_4685 [Granulicella mallensis MP5ACTX8]